MFVLAGYSTCLIAFPSVAHPEAIFTTAILRVQDIALGIVCSAVVHATFMPSSSGKLLLDRIDAARRDAGHWTASALSKCRPETLDRDRRGIATAVNEIHDLVIHSGYENAHNPGQRRLCRAFLAQLERVLPLSAAVDDRIVELRQMEAMPPDVDILLAEVADWVATTAAGDSNREKEAERLRERCAEREPTARPGLPWEDALLLSLLARLADLIAVHANCLLLGSAISSPPKGAEERRRIKGLLVPKSRAIYRDYIGALAAGVSTTIALFTACLLWIASGWQGGASAVMLAGVFFALYSSFGNPALLLKNKFTGVIIRLMLGALYVLIILPSIDGFESLAISLAPVLLISGVLLTTPRYSALAFNLIIGVLSPSIIAERFEPDFAAYLNNGLATLTGIYFALTMMRLLQPLWLEGAAQRMLQAGWTDIASGRHRDVMRWRSRMGHRLALLTMRAAKVGATDSRPTVDALRDLRTGLSLAELAKLRPTLSEKSRCMASSIHEDVADHYRRLTESSDNAPPIKLRDEIDQAMDTGMEGTTAGVARAATLALVSLRRNIFPVPGSALNA
jgi:uncharacterized membrane protein YccC